MKILYINHARESSGWSSSAINHALAMNAVGLDVVCRSVKLNGACGELSAEYLELENKDSKDCDVCIQNLLPSYLEYDGRFSKNICQLFLESNLCPAAWVEKINLFDECWVACYHNKIALERSGVTIPIKVVPCTINLNKYKKNYPITNIRAENPDAFIFLAVAEWTERKDFSALIRAFHAAFHPDENVLLVIKTGISGLSPPQAIKQIEEQINKIKDSLRLYLDRNIYKKEILILDRLSEDALYSVYKSCDAFVNTSRGEGFCLPVMEAMAFGMNCIVPCHTSFEDLPNDAAWWLTSYDAICAGEMNQIPGVHAGNDTWYQTDEVDLKFVLRQVYKMPKSREATSINAYKAAQNYSYEKVGNTIKELLLNNE